MAERKKIPVTILTGFLGSGKTTLMNHILQDPNHGMRFAIIENEFGEVGVDDKVIKEQVEDQVIEVMNGCICCTVRSDLADALKRMTAKLKDFDGVIIETTGLADPAPVAQTFFVDEDVERNYKLDGIITVVDAKHIMGRLQEEKPEGVENESVEQVAFADRILLNKCDLVDEATLVDVEKAVKAINSGADVIRSQYSKVDPSKLINLGAFSLEKVLEMDPQFLDTDGEHQHDSSVSSTSVRFEGELNHLMLRMFLSDLIQSKGNDLFRYKGVLAVKGMQSKFVFQGVQMIFDGGFEEKFMWKPNEVRECRVVFIGRNLDKESLQRNVMACKVTDEPLRFQVGDTVEAKCKGWRRGTIIAHWHNGNPYLIALHDGTEVWGPLDDDMFVRKPESATAATGAQKHSPWWDGSQEGARQAKYRRTSS